MSATPIIAPRLDGIPPELKAISQWVGWKRKPPKKPGDKFGKVPIDPKSGRHASATDPATWGSFEEAVDRMHEDLLDGIGFVFAPEASIAGVDLDHCRDPDTGTLEPWAVAIVERLASYTELSPSGTGVHIFCRGKLPAGGRRQGNVEMYDESRFFTVTGSHLDGTPIEIQECQAELEAVHREFIVQRGRKSRPASRAASREAISGVTETDAGSRNKPERDKAGAPPDDDELIIRKAGSLKNGPKFKSLYAGDRSAHPSKSPRGAEWSVVSTLTFFAGPDHDRIDRLFRNSGLMSPWWDEPHTDYNGEPYTRRDGTVVTNGYHAIHSAIAKRNPNNDFHQWKPTKKSRTRPNTAKVAHDSERFPQSTLDDAEIERRINEQCEKDGRLRSVWDLTFRPGDQSQSAADLYLLGSLIRARWGHGDALRAMQLFRIKSSESPEKADREDYLRKTLDAALESAARSENGDDPTALQVCDDNTIVLSPGELHTAVDRAEAALLTSDPVMFQRGGELVRVIRLQSVEQLREGVRVPAGTSLISAVTADFLLDHLGRIRRFVKLGQEGDLVPCDPPPNLAHRILARSGNWQLPTLISVVTSPQIFQDGSIIATPGFYPEHGILFDPQDVDFPAIPDNPARADAIHALALLEELVGGFPFVEDHDRACAIAMLVSAVARSAYGSGPLFLVTAPVMSSGKSTLTELAALVVTGHPPAKIEAAESEEETEKRVLALLLAGARFVCFDNAEGVLGGTAICRVLTETTFAGRVLGESRIVNLRTIDVHWTANGNNVRPRGDLTSRTAVIRLDPREERPWMRKWRTPDPRKFALERRPELVVAAITILRAYIIAGRPSVDLPPYRFAAWSELIRAALVWLGLPDPLARTTEAVEREPEIELLDALMDAWAACFGGEAMRVAEVLRQPYTWSDSGLNEALDAIAPDGRGSRAIRLGKFLERFQDRVVGGRRFRRGRKRNVAVWRLETVDAAPAASSAQGQDRGALSEWSESSECSQPPDVSLARVCARTHARAHTPAGARGVAGTTPTTPTTPTGSIDGDPENGHAVAANGALPQARVIGREGRAAEHQPPHAPCVCCKAMAWWRLRGDGTAPGPWVCGRCHPPTVPAEAVERAEEDARA